MTPEMRALFTGVEVMYFPVFIAAIIFSSNPAATIGALLFTGLVLLVKVSTNKAYLIGFIVVIFLQIFVY